MNKKGLFALALGTFALGITEFLTMGILSDLATSLGVSIPMAGHLISAYAAGVCAGAPALLFARKMDLRKLMLLLAIVITVGNLMAALAPGYVTLMLARFISGLPHGAYFGVGAIVARKLANPSRQVSAVAMMVSGMTVATLAGVPLGTWLSNAVSWRAAYLVVALSGAVTWVAIHRWVPRVPGLEDLGFRGQFRFMRTLPPWLIFIGILFGQTGIYCWYSYIDPQLTLISGFAPENLSWLMVVAGFGMFAGNIVAGWLGIRFKPSAIAASVMGLAIPILCAFYLLATVKVAAVILLMLGTAALFGSGSPLQSDIVGYCRGGEMLGAALIQIAYNAGNAISAWLGGAVISAGYSVGAPAIVGMPLTLIGTILIAILYFKYERVKTS
ncbi:MAG: MFS transporter [Candidatus Amulumruptor caecigallinarius]|nr:MFS transporter [Candidatus Amulumruptor caecigallinarius]MCM1396807.1 MFS transporter [Candidatus Amulumruptor caecigallinarius]MCM1454249.1 MFS transporter [bacterium]